MRTSEGHVGKGRASAAVDPAATPRSAAYVTNAEEPSGRGLLHPVIRSAVLEALFGTDGGPSPTVELQRVVSELAASSDARLRRQTLAFRLLERANGDPERRSDVQWQLLSDEASGVEREDRIEAFGEALIMRVLSDGWLKRGQFGRSAAFLSESIFWARRARSAELESSLITAMGSVLTLAGYVAEGLAAITRTAAGAIDFSTHRFIGDGGRLDEGRRQVIELADADEHSRNYRRALLGLQLATSLMGPIEQAARSASYMALARCLCRVGRPEMAAEVFADVAADPAPLSPFLLAKLARTRTLMHGAAGDIAGALDACSHALTPVLRNQMLGLFMEVLVDGMAVARRADEPAWVVAHADEVEHPHADGVGLLWTFAYEDLAWAYRRLGDRRNAARCRAVARTGRERFAARSGYWPLPDHSAPGVLGSSRKMRALALRSRDTERVSLARGIGSVSHDVRNQLQSIECLTELDDWGAGGADAVRSVVTVIDDIWSGLLRDVEADREIELTDVCLTTVAHAVAARFRSSAQHKRIELLCDLNQPISCRSDRVALDRIVSNLVSNAIKYSPVGGMVEITTTTLGDSFIDLHVIDSGPGIPSTEVDDLFRWGGTLSSEPTAGETQQGIGLFTAQRLARLTGASIRPHPRRQDVPSTMSVRLARS